MDECMIINYERKRNNLKELILKECIKIGKFKLSSGKESNFYIDLRSLLLTPNFLNLMLDNIQIKIRYLEYDFIAGMTSGADPIICSMMLRFIKKGIFIRKTVKTYGTSKVVEGDIYKNESKKVLIVDDVLTTGNSIEKVWEALIRENMIPVGILVIVDRQENNAEDVIQKFTNIPLFSLFKKDDFFLNEVS